MPQGGGCQHTSNVLPSGGRGDVKEAAASIDAARSDDVRRNPTDAHQRRPLRGRSLATLSSRSTAVLSTRVQRKFVGGESSRSSPAASEVRPGRHLLLTTAHFFRGCAREALRHRRMFHQEVSPVFISPGVS